MRAADLNVTSPQRRNQVDAGVPTGVVHRKAASSGARDRAVHPKQNGSQCPLQAVGAAAS